MRVDCARIQSTSGIRTGLPATGNTGLTVSHILPRQGIVPRFPERYLFLNSERPGDKIYALIARAIATPESSDEFEAVITELRAALKEHIHRIRTKAVSYLPPSDSDL